MRNRYFLAADILLLTCSAVAAFSLRFDLLFFRTRPEATIFLLAALLVKPAVFLRFGVYKRYWPAASTGELGILVAANVVASLVLGLLASLGLLTGLVQEFSRSVLLIDLLISLIVTGGIRLVVRIVADSTRRLRKPVAPPSAERRRALILGAGEAGVLMAREARRNPQVGIEVVGFLDDDPVKHRKRIAGVDVHGPLDALERTVREHRVDEVIIALPTAPGSVVRPPVETCRRLGVRSRTVPGVFELLTDGVSIRRLRDVEIADLLRRNPVQRAPTSAAYLADSVVLITGAGGSVGGELCRQVASAGPKRLILLGHGENSIFDISLEIRRLFPTLVLETPIADVRDGRRLRHLLEAHRPQVVFHAAAHKHVPLMEANPEEAITNNVIGTAFVLDAAIRADVDRLVLISTDKAVSPTSIMGASKRLAEHLVRLAALQTGRRFSVVRFGNVLGSRGSVVPQFTKQIERGGPITITHPDMRRYFMTIPEAVHLVLEAGGFGQAGQVYVLNMGDPVRVVDLAQDLIRLSGADPRELAIEFTGLRPGEKLLEELWEDDARVEETVHPDVFHLIEPTRGRIDDEMTSLLAVVSRQDHVGPVIVERLLALCSSIVKGQATPSASR